MVGDILIIDCVATNRIVLKVKLLAAQYRVRLCATLHEAQVEIDAALPDLILLDTGSNTADALEFCTGLKASGRTNLVPIIATGGFVVPRDRVAAPAQVVITSERADLAVDFNTVEDGLDNVCINAASVQIFCPVV